MRTTLAWSVSVPSMIAGLLAAHAVAHRAAGSAEHAYALYAPWVLGPLAAVTLVGFALLAAAAARGRELEAVPPGAFAVLPPLAFAGQETLERALAGGSPVAIAGEPAFLLGLLLQVPFGLLAYVTGRLLAAAATTLAQALAVRPPRLAAVFPDAPLPALDVPVARHGLGFGRSERGPPHASD